MEKRPFSIIPIQAAFGAAVVLMLSAFSVSAHPLFHSPSSTPFNTKFKQWSAQWWQFVLSFPGAENPFLDPTGGRCMIGQRGPVWFLMSATGGSVSRTCAIPTGKSLFFPIVNFANVNTPNLPGSSNQTAPELRADIAPCLDAVTALSVEVDGQQLINFDKKDKFRIKSKVFEAAIPANGFFPAGIYSPAVDDGFYIMLKPLAPGQHTLHIAAARNGCPSSPAPFSVDVNYSLTVVPVN
jgi:hypothetical protein